MKFLPLPAWITAVWCDGQPAGVVVAPDHVAARRRRRSCRRRSRPAGSCARPALPRQHVLRARPGPCPSPGAGPAASRRGSSSPAAGPRERREQAPQHARSAATAASASAAGRRSRGRMLASVHRREPIAASAAQPTRDIRPRASPAAGRRRGAPRALGCGHAADPDGHRAHRARRARVRHLLAAAQRAHHLPRHADRRPGREPRRGAAAAPRERGPRQGHLDLHQLARRQRSTRAWRSTTR